MNYHQTLMHFIFELAFFHCLRVKNTPAKLADDTKSCLKSIGKWEDGQMGT